MYQLLNFNTLSNIHIEMLKKYIANLTYFWLGMDTEWT